MQWQCETINFSTDEQSSSLMSHHKYSDIKSKSNGQFLLFSLAIYIVTHRSLLSCPFASQRKKLNEKNCSQNQSNSHLSETLPSLVGRNTVRALFIVCLPQTKCEEDEMRNENNTFVRKPKTCYLFCWSLVLFRSLFAFNCRHPNRMT